MPSPFPGMNPYLENENVWHTFHKHFCVACAEALTPLVRPKYFVTFGELVYLHEIPAKERLIPGPAVDEERISFIEIVERKTRRLVTVVSLLSPPNKQAGADREQYMQKRRQLHSSNTHLVEIDLLRGGQRPLDEVLPPCDYCITVSRYDEGSRISAWPIRLREPLPVVPVPLDARDPPVALDVQMVLHQRYDAGGFEDYIYAGTPQPALSAADALWARELLGPHRFSE